MVVHTVPLLTDQRLLARDGPQPLMIAVGLSTMAGRLLSGYLVDKIFAPFVAASFFPAPVPWNLPARQRPLSGSQAIISLGLASGYRN